MIRSDTSQQYTAAALISITGTSPQQARAGENHRVCGKKIPGVPPYSWGPAERMLKVLLRTLAAAHPNMAGSRRLGAFAFGPVPEEQA
jgi:hypothetical protein